MNADGASMWQHDQGKALGWPAGRQGQNTVQLQPVPSRELDLANFATKRRGDIRVVVLDEVSTVIFQIYQKERVGLVASRDPHNDSGGVV